MASSKTNMKKILDFITKRYAENGVPPTIREICTAVGLKSTSSVQGYIDKLVAEGHIYRSENKKRSIVPANTDRTVSVPLIGRVAAGMPILASENFEGQISVPSSYIKSGKHFALTIKGDSMKDAGILNGDTIIVRQTPVAENGDIVVALIGEEATVKYFYKEDGLFVLRPANIDYKPIITTEMSVIGKVVSVIRYY